MLLHMGAQQKPKTTKGVRNDGRKNGKAWKKGKHHDVREAEAAAKREARTPEQKAAAEQRRMLREERRAMLSHDSDD